MAGLRAVGSHKGWLDLVFGLGWAWVAIATSSRGLESIVGLMCSMDPSIEYLLRGRHLLLYDVRHGDGLVGGPNDWVESGSSSTLPVGTLAGSA